MYSFENIIGERNSVLSPVINEKISKTSVFIIQNIKKNLCYTKLTVVDFEDRGPD